MGRMLLEPRGSLCDSRGVNHCGHVHLACLSKSGGVIANQSMQQHRGFSDDGEAETAGAHIQLHRRRGGR
jgi:hypothetical protein